MKITIPKNRIQFHKPHPRGGFSLIELMIVIVIIAILLAMLLPAIGGASSTAKIVQVVTDIKDIEKALADFELKYGVVPPSRIRLVEDGSYTSNADERATLAFFRQVWPNFNPTTVSIDFDGDGTIDDNTSAKVLSGAECLVFWLLGHNPTVEPGFSNNPSNPFAVGGSRIGPFIEVDLARLTDTNSNGFEEYRDPLVSSTQPYEFFSSGGGRAYNRDHTHPYANGMSRMQTVYWSIDTNWPDLTGGTTTAVGDLPEVSRATIAPSTPQKAKSYQIISPGFDGEFGHGGLYTDNSVAIWESTSDPDTTRDRAARAAESDNITNFSSGELGDLKSFIWDR